MSQFRVPIYIFAAATLALITKELLKATCYSISPKEFVQIRAAEPPIEEIPESGLQKIFIKISLSFLHQARKKHFCIKMNCRLVAITTSSILALTVVSYFGYKFYIQYTTPAEMIEEVMEEVTKKKKNLFKKANP
ncbi:unnamed protein product [Chironomus riparius]|uniref:Uncharacterized protein n=1 Tax=Chironomus riparius TaxID=315576 RepID=A0A9N9WQY7_9DIPT|nr:unnamed protein product [Chironomus riparius]